MSLAFHVDTRYCSGCKSCQLACKDKNDLPVGQIWRRVYEIVGGNWESRGNAWISHVRAYNVSISCNHCQRCICVEVCPAKAFQQDADGVVRIDQDRCMGCRYCAWACPYNAPQFDARLGRMGKCDFCRDRIDAGKDPACVAACPMRVISWGTREELEKRFGKSVDIFPLPAQTMTEPALFVQAHCQAGPLDDPDLKIANPEEV